MPKTIFLAAAACLVCVLTTARAFWTICIPQPVDHFSSVVPPAVITSSSPQMPATATRVPASRHVHLFLVGQWAVGDGCSKFGDLRMDFDEDGSMKLIRIAPPGGENIEEPGNWRVRGDVVEMWSANQDDQVGWTASATVTAVRGAFQFQNGTFTPKGLSSRELSGELQAIGTFSGDLDLPFRCGNFGGTAVSAVPVSETTSAADSGH